MKEGFEVGVMVSGRTPDGTHLIGTLTADPNRPYGWKNPCYSGGGWYFVKFDGDDRLMVVNEDEITLAENVRYVVTNMNKDGTLRELTFPGQGRYTYATREEALEQLALFEPSLREKILKERADTLAVRAVECWPVHHDPKQTVW